MTLKQLITPFPWSRYSKRLIAKIERPRSYGVFTEEESADRTMRLASSRVGSLKEGNILEFYWLVDPDDGVIVDVRFQAYGQSALIGAAEAASELLIGKNYDQAKRISTDLIDKQLRDKPDVAAFPHEAAFHLNLTLQAIDEAAEKCQDLPLGNYIAPPAPIEIGEVLEGGYPGWEALSLQEKLSLIESVVARDVRPYIELDAGGITVLDLVKGFDVIIEYQGSCTTCFSATGTTLAYIQQVLRAKLHPELNVIPNL